MGAAGWCRSTRCLIASETLMGYLNDNPPWGNWSRYPAKVTQNAAMHAVARMADAKMKEDAKGLALIEETMRVKRPEFQEVGEPLFKLNIAPGSINPTTRSGVLYRGGDPEYRSEFDARGRNHAEPFNLTSVRPKHYLRPEEEFSRVAPHNTLIRYEGQKPYDYVGPILEDMTKRHSARVEDVGFPGESARLFDYERDVHIGPTFVSGLGEVSRKETIKEQLRTGKIDIKQVLARIKRRKEAKEESEKLQKDIIERELQLQRKETEIAKQQAALAVGRRPVVAPAFPTVPLIPTVQLPIPKKERPIWLIPAAVGGGLLLLGTVILARK